MPSPSEGEVLLIIRGQTVDKVGWGTAKGLEFEREVSLHMFQFPKHEEIPYAFEMRSQNYAHYGNKTKKKKN